MAHLMGTHSEAKWTSDGKMHVINLKHKACNTCETHIWIARTYFLNAFVTFLVGFHVVLVAFAHRCLQPIPWMKQQ